MSVSSYDENLIEKLKSWTANTQVNMYGPDETSRLFEVIADNTNDKPIALPIIALSRPNGFTVKNTNKQPLTYDGYRLDSNEESSLVLNAIPILLEYQLDIYTRYRKDADAYARELIFNIINHPSFEVVIPYYDLNIVHVATLRMESDVQDNSSVPERIIPGQFTRLTIRLNVDDAYLWHVPQYSNYHIADSLTVVVDDEVTEVVKVDDNQ